MLFNWFMLGTFYCSVFLILDAALRADSLLSNDAVESVTFWLRTVYVALLLLQLLAGLNVKPQYAVPVHNICIVGFGSFMALLFASSIWIVSQGELEREHIIAAAGAFGSIVLTAFIHGDLLSVRCRGFVRQRGSGALFRFCLFLGTFITLWLSGGGVGLPFLFTRSAGLFVRGQRWCAQVVSTFVQYYLSMPIFINMFSIYSFCNLHDISWGTKEGSTANVVAREAAAMEFARDKLINVAQLVRRKSQSRRSHSPLPTGGADTDTEAQNAAQNASGGGAQHASALGAQGSGREGKGVPRRANKKRRRRRKRGSGKQSQSGSLSRLDSRSSVESDASDVSAASATSGTGAGGEMRLAADGNITFKPSLNTMDALVASANANARATAGTPSGGADDTASLGGLSAKSNTAGVSAPWLLRGLSPLGRAKAKAKLVAAKRAAALAFNMFRTRMLAAWLVSNYLLATLVFTFELGEAFGSVVAFGVVIAISCMCYDVVFVERGFCVVTVVAVDAGCGVTTCPRSPLTCSALCCVLWRVVRCA